MTWSLLINVFLLEGILNIITFLTFPTVCSALKKKQQLCINTPRKLNVEPEHMPLEQETIPSETTIFRFHVIFSEVTRNSKDLELRKKHIDSFNPELWIGVAMSESDSLSSDSSDSGTSDEVQWIGDVECLGWYD